MTSTPRRTELHSCHLPKNFFFRAVFAAGCEMERRRCRAAGGVSVLSAECGKMFARGWRRARAAGRRRRGAIDCGVVLVSCLSSYTERRQATRRSHRRAPSLRRRCISNREARRTQRTAGSATSVRRERRRKPPPPTRERARTSSCGARHPRRAAPAPAVARARPRVRPHVSTRPPRNDFTSDERARPSARKRVSRTRNSSGASVIARYFIFSERTTTSLPFVITQNRPHKGMPRYFSSRGGGFARF